MSTNPTVPVTSPAVPAAVTKSPVVLTQTQKVAQIVQLCGVAAFAVGMVFSVHHYAIGVLCLSGALAYVIGQKLRGV